MHFYASSELKKNLLQTTFFDKRGRGGSVTAFMQALRSTLQRGWQLCSVRVALSGTMVVATRTSFVRAERAFRMVICRRRASAVSGIRIAQPGSSPRHSSADRPRRRSSQVIGCSHLGPADKKLRSIYNERRPGIVIDVGYSMLARARSFV